MKTCAIRLVAVFCLLWLVHNEAYAQRWSIGTNAVDYLNLGTFNAEGSVSVARHSSVYAGVRYNPWTFHYGDRQIQNRKRCLYTGLRYWPWHVYSGWWAGLQCQYQEYNRGGIFSPRTEEGDAWGVGFSIGYTLMLGKSFNMEFGAGVWAGTARYTAYSCPSCGEILDQGRKSFLWPDNVRVSFVYIL